MDHAIFVLLVLATVLIVFKAVFLWWIFGSDIREYLQEKRGKGAETRPECMYCRSKWTRPIDEGEARWENESLVLVTTYECEHCRLPMWHVERVPVGSRKQ